ncbi:hypothetical protein ACFV0W_24525, partial [Streptomyces anulatus]
MTQSERNERQRLRPAPLLFEPSQAAADPEHFFDLESLEDPRELLARATELTQGGRGGPDPGGGFRAGWGAPPAPPPP